VTASPAGTARTPDARPLPLPVLMYHSVGGALPERLRDLSVPAHRLDEQLGALADADYALVGLTEALARHARGDRVVGLTFDDGYTDFVDAALEVLARHDARSTLYVPTRHLGGHATWLPDGGHLAILDGEAVREVADRGHEIGSHGAVHVPLDVLPGAQAAAQLRESRRVLEDVVARRVESFCYPHGYHSRRLREQVRRAGYTNACAIGHRTSPAGEDPWAVSRLLVGPDHDGPAVLRLVQEGGPRGAVPALKRLAGPAWRATRRTALATGRTWT